MYLLVDVISDVHVCEYVSLMLNKVHVCIPVLKISLRVTFFDYMWKKSITRYNTRLHVEKERYTLQYSTRLWKKSITRYNTRLHVEKVRYTLQYSTTCGKSMLRVTIFDYMWKKRVAHYNIRLHVDKTRYNSRLHMEKARYALQYSTTCGKGALRFILSYLLMCD